MATPKEEVPPGQVMVCITADALSAISPHGEIVDDRDSALREALGKGARLRPVFDEEQARLRQQAADARGRRRSATPDLSRFYRVETDTPLTESGAKALVHGLRSSGLVQAAYFKHPHELPVRPRTAVTPGAAPELRTPDFTGQQGYIDPAPGGVDARCAWAGPGGAGAGVQIIDIEGAWRFSHEDLLQNQGGALNGPLDDLGARNHGTSVAGILSGDANAFGITGICPEATISGISVAAEPGGSAAAIRRAADRLRAGDIVLLEQHTFGPVSLERARTIRAGRTGGYVPTDIWAEDFAAVRYATSRGVIVVAAAGNGGRELDEVDDLLTVGHRERFANPFDRKEADSGAIFVGAGAPPGGDRPDRSRLDFSNYGSCVDAQGWGNGVVTTGGVEDGEGDLQGGPYEDRWYTNSFSGTSSAAPMIAGVLACVQGVLMAEGFPPMTPRQARALLRMTGTPQAPAAAGEPVQRIGPRPDLCEFIPRALMLLGGADFMGGGGDPSPYGGMSVTIVLGGSGGGSEGWGGDDPWGGSSWAGPHWRGPHWRGPHWRGPHWRGPHWRGPHWRGPSWDDPDASGPLELRESDFDGSAGSTDDGPREIRLPGFMS